MTWDPDRYLNYADERGRPFVELVARVAATDPKTVVDLGCGPGNLTVLLADRWPGASITGVDSSAEMIAAAPAGRVRFEVGAIEEWDGSADVVVSNAALQWVPGHLSLLPAMAARAQEWFAFQVPGNYDQPTHTIRADLAADARFSPYLGGIEHPFSYDAETYLEVLSLEGWAVDGWETTYLHVLEGDDAVFAWVSATGARPTLAALPEGVREEFVAEFKARLDEAYPSSPQGTVMPFRRVFVVAHR